MCLMVCTDRYSSEFSEKLNFFWVLIRTMRKPWNPYHPWRSTETPTDISAGAVVCTSWLLFASGHMVKISLKSSSRTHLHHLGRREVLPLCSITSSITGYHSGFPGGWLHMGQSTWLLYLSPASCIDHISWIAGCSTGAFLCPLHTTRVLP